MEKYIIIGSTNGKISILGLNGEYSGEEAFHQIREEVKYMLNEKIWDDIVVLDFEDFKLNKFGTLSPYVCDVSLPYDDTRRAK